MIAFQTLNDQVVMGQLSLVETEVYLKR